MEGVRITHIGGPTPCSTSAAGVCSPIHVTRIAALSQRHSLPQPIGLDFGLEELDHHHKEGIVKIVVIGGTGLIGSKVRTKLRESGFEAVAAAHNTGVNTITGEGLAEARTRASH
jgi:hypothetical protein